MTYRASRLGARVVEVPITFRDRRLGQSKMSRRIIVEALFVVIGLRWDELRGRGPVREPCQVTVRLSGWRRGLRPPAEPRAPPASGSCIDVRPIQDPERAPLTAIYLEPLLAALDADPVDGESFSFLLAADRDDPTPRWPGLAGRRPPPACRRRGCCAPAPSPSDPLLLRGASVGAGWRAERGGAAGHRLPRGGAARCRSRRGIPVVAALLDLAPWAMPRGVPARDRRALRAAAPGAPAQGRGRGARPGPRAPATRPAACSACQARPAAGRAARAAARVPPRGAAARAARSATRLGSRAAVRGVRRPLRRPPGPADAARRARAARRRAAAARTGRGHRRRGRRASASWAPRPTTVPRSRAPRSATASRTRSPTRPACRTSGSPGSSPAPGSSLQPARSEATGLVALEAIAAGVPVVGQRGRARCPRSSAAAGILVEPGDPARLATAIGAAWSDDDLHPALVAAAASGARRCAPGRTWRGTRARPGPTSPRPAPLL